MAGGLDDRRHPEAQGLIAARSGGASRWRRARSLPARRKPNEEWSIDFKGWFRTRDGARCDPLTVADTASRYLIEARIVEPTWAGVR